MPPYTQEETRRLIDRPRAEPTLVDGVLCNLKQYAQREPVGFAAWVFGLGFVLGWKLKPW